MTFKKIHSLKQILLLLFKLIMHAFLIKFVLVSQIKIILAFDRVTNMPYWFYCTTPRSTHTDKTGNVFIFPLVCLTVQEIKKE